jgi:hypothetical protein
MKLGTAVTLPRDPDADLDHWLDPFLDVTGQHAAQMAPLYRRGLLGRDGRKSIQPTAARLGLSGHGQLHHSGLHRHALMTCIALAYPQHRRLKAAGRGKKAGPDGPPPPSLPEIRRAIIAKLFAPPAVPYRCPDCHRRISQHASKVPR